MNPNEIKRRFKNASPSFIKANSDFIITGIPPDKPQSNQGGALDGVEKGEDKGGARFEITFTVYAQRPNDWDNPRTKELQDCLRNAGILHDDAWDVLQGRVITRKANSKEEERTEITLIPIEYGS